jgi:hypothetical protein
MKFSRKQENWRHLCIGMTVFFTFFSIICNGCGGGDGDDKSPTLSSIAVTPATPSIPLGTTKAFTAMGTYSDGSTQNITATATWTSSNNGVATVASSGIATSVNQGTSEIRAAVNSISGSTTLTLVRRCSCRLRFPQQPPSSITKALHNSLPQQALTLTIVQQILQMLSHGNLQTLELCRLIQKVFQKSLQ